MTVLQEPKHGIDYKSKYASSISAWLFALFTLVGSAYIYLSKNYFLPQTLVTLGPVLIMLLFGGIMWLAPKLKIRDDQAGDNLYYMGFIFTLVSLATSLSQFSATQKADDIVRNFGIAISSTIVGITLRIVFSGMRQDPVEIERQARLELAEAARRVRKELDDSVLEFASYRRATQQSLDDGFREITEQVDRVSAAIMASLEQVAQNYVEPLSTVSRQSEQSLKEISQLISLNLKQINTASGTQTKRIIEKSDLLVTAIEGLADRLSNTETPDRTFNIVMTPALQEFVSHLDRFGIVLKNQGERLDISAKEITGSLRTVLHEFESLGHGLRDDNLGLQRSLDTFEKRVTEGTESNLQKTQAQLSRVEGALRAIFDFLKRLNP